ERVSHLILFGGFALGGNKRGALVAETRKAMATLMRLGWGSDNQSFRQLFTAQFVPDGDKDLIDAFNELQRLTTSPETAVRYFEALGDLDVRPLLPKVSVPTLVMHVRGDLLIPIENGQQLAAGIPHAKFVTLEGRNHLLLKGEPAFDRFFQEIELFLGGAR